MYVGQLLVKGYRSLKDVSIDFRPGINVLVGKNNAGKSNIIRALDLVLGERWPTYVEVEERDFYQSPDGSSVDRFLIAVRLDGKGINQDMIRDGTRAQIFEFKVQGSLWDDLEKLEEEPQGGEWKTDRRLRDFLQSATSLWLYLIVPKGGERKERTYAALLQDENGKWHQMRKFGDNVRDALLTTTYVPSFRDPSQQLRITQYSWYGKLIKSLYTQQTPDQANRIQQAQQQLTETVGEIFQETTSELRQRLQRAVFHHGVSFKPGAYTPDDAHKQITIFIDDGLDTPYYDKGSGIQSALVIALFAYYCKHFHKGGSLLLVEEPEIYLHPQARRAMEEQLAAFVREGISESACNHQVIISTHATEFLRSAELEGIIYVHKPPKQTATQTRQIRSGQIAGDVQTRWKQVIQARNAEMFFADFVILVEGGEEYVLPALADLRFGEKRWLDTRNVSVVRVDGKRQFKAYSDILSALEIPHCILADLDFLLEGIEDFFGRNTHAPCSVDHDFRKEVDHDSRKEIEKLRERVRQHSQSAQPRGRDVRAALNPDTRDWVQLYVLVDQAIRDLTDGSLSSLSPERLKEIKDLWGRLKERILKPGLDAIGDVSTLLEQLKGRGFFILSRGELEDYFTQEAMQLEASKDRRALLVAQHLSGCQVLDEAKKWLTEYDEFIALLDYVDRQVKSLIGSDRDSEQGQQKDLQSEQQEEIPF